MWNIYKRKKKKKRKLKAKYEKYILTTLIIIIFFKIVFKINFSQKVLIKKKEIEKRIILFIRKKELYLIYFLHNNFYKEKTFRQAILQFMNSYK